MFHRDPAHTGFLGDSAPTSTPSILWQQNVEDSISSSPAIVDGIVFVTANEYGLYAFNATTGARIWKVNNGGSGSPAVSDGIVYTGTGLCSAYNSSTGHKIWNVTAVSAMSGSIGAISDDVVYVTAQTRSTGNVYAINAKEGRVIWNYTGSALSAPAETNGIVFFGGKGAIIALKASNGDKVWDYQTDSRVETSPAVALGIVYASSFNGSFYAINASTGEKIWTYPAGGYSSPAIVNGIVYFGSYTNVYALNASTGSEIWNYTTMYLVDSSPIVAKEAVSVGSDDGNLYALNVYSGSKLWNYSIQPILDEHGLDRYLFASPAVFNKTIFMGSNDGVLYALHEKSNTPTPNLPNPYEKWFDITLTAVVIFIVVLSIVAGIILLVKRKREL